MGQTQVLSRSKSLLLNTRSSSVKIAKKSAWFRGLIQTTSIGLCLMSICHSVV